MQGRSFPLYMPAATHSIDYKHFFSYVRSHLFGGFLHQSQVDGLEGVLDYWEQQSYTDFRHIAYILATVYHETDRTFQPLREYGRGRGYAYGVPDPKTGQVYYGRGLVQLTWKENYSKFAKLLHLDLVNDPDLALQLQTAIKILFYGMLHGTFTGRKLEDFFNSDRCDWVHAREIVNGLDKAELIASYARQFYSALSVMPIQR